MEAWINLLTQYGYDLIGTAGYTARAESRNCQWNSNHPMVHMSFYFKALPEQKAKIPHIVLNTYGTHGRIDTIYAIGFSGKAVRRYAGFTINGSRELEIGTIDALKEILEKLPMRNF